MSELYFAAFDARTDELIASLTVEGDPQSAARCAAWECGELFAVPYYLTSGSTRAELMRAAGYDV